MESNRRRGGPSQQLVRLSLARFPSGTDRLAVGSHSFWRITCQAFEGAS